MKFKVTVSKEVEEKMLGSFLASLPDDLTIDIARLPEETNKRKTSFSNANTPHERKDIIDLEKVLREVSFTFPSKELIPEIVKAGFSAGSISHFIRRCINAGLLKKVDGTAGTATLYEKIKR